MFDVHVKTVAIRNYSSISMNCIQTVNSQNHEIKKCAKLELVVVEVARFCLVVTRGSFPTVEDDRAQTFSETSHEFCSSIIGCSNTLALL